MKRRQFQYQFRLVWRYRGQKMERRLVSDNPNKILRMLRRVGTDEPWMGVSPTQLRRTWAWLARRLNVEFGAVSHLSPKNALLALRDSFPKLEYIRVETRQVAPWVEMLDPLTNLRTAGTAKADQKKLAILKQAEEMTRETLDAWRWVPDESTQRLRTRGDHNVRD